DSCNVVYAMWRIEPKSGLVVSVKSNPGKHTHAECGNSGYTNVKPATSKPLPALAAGDSRTLRADLNGDRMRVLVDRDVVWEGALGPEASAFEGPVGVRSDDAAFDFDLLATAAPAVRPCSSDSGREGD